jgi:phage terminase small subunit
MPILFNPRHEKFAQGLAEGKPASAAYEEAEYRPNDGNAIRLKGNERIQSRVTELQEQGADRAAVTLQSLIAEAGDIQTKALASGHYSAAVSALTVKAKLAGLWVDRGENKANQVIHLIRDRPLTAEEWTAMYCTSD